MSKNFYATYDKILLTHSQEAAQFAAVGFIAGNTPVSPFALSLDLLPKLIQEFYFGDRNFALWNLGFQPDGESGTEGYDRSGMEVSVPLLIWLGLAFSLLLILFS